MLKRIVGAIITLTMVAGVSACGTQQSNEPKYADDEAMSVIAKGLQKRFDVLDQQEKKRRKTAPRTLRRRFRLKSITTRN